MVNASYGYDDDGQDWFYDDGSWTHEPDDTWDDAPDAIAAHIDASMPAAFGSGRFGVPFHSND